MQYFISKVPWYLNKFCSHLAIFFSICPTFQWEMDLIEGVFVYLRIYHPFLIDSCFQINRRWMNSSVDSKNWFQFSFSCVLSHWIHFGWTNEKLFCFYFSWSLIRIGIWFKSIWNSENQLWIRFSNIPAKQTHRVVPELDLYFSDNHKWDYMFVSVLNSDGEMFWIALTRVCWRHKSLWVFCHLCQ